MIELPTISIVTCCYNPDLEIFKKSLESVSRQFYPKKNIEHIVMDGGSMNGAVSIARKYGCQVVDRHDLLNKALTRMALGIKVAKNDMILFLEPDNIIQGKNWLKQMTKPLIDDPQIIGTFSMYNGYEKRMPLLTKYYALIGANDPILYYLQKSEKLTHLESKYSLGKLLCKKSGYIVVEFDKYTLPTLGDNGHMVRRKLISGAIKDPAKFLHTDAFFELNERGYTRYGVVKNSIIHYAGHDIFKNLMKRAKYKSQFYRNANYERVYHVFSYHSKKDLYKLVKFILYSLTIVQPLSMSIRGYLKNKELAWFLHPVMCLGTLIAYSISEIKSLKRYA